MSGFSPASVPLATLALLGTNLAVHGLLFLTSFSPGHLAIAADFVLRRGEIYRLLSAAFVHGGLLHIFMNMSSLLSLGAHLETQFGSLSFLLMYCWSSLSFFLPHLLLGVFGRPSSATSSTSSFTPVSV